MEDRLPSFRPGEFYFRQAYRDAATQEGRDELFFALVRDHEQLREWCRQQGLIPPKFEFTRREVEEKPWLLSLASSGQLELELPEPEQPRQGELLLFPKEPR